MSSDTLKTLCQSTETSIGEAARWIADERNVDVVGRERTPLLRSLKLAKLRAQRLKKAIERPMCVGVFGPSQAGKSYLVEVLARPEGGTLKAKFEGIEPVDFLREINPIGEKESTGLVTRFTAAAPSVPAPAKFPVRLRMLNETDLVKILGNTFILDGDQTKEPAPTAEFIADHMAALRSKAVGARGLLTEEKILELRDYFEKNFTGARAVEVLRNYWDDLKDIVDRLALPERAEAFSLLWGRHKPFTVLFIELAGALEKLGAVDEIYAPMVAIVPREGSILDVATLAGLGGEDGEPITVSTSSGLTLTLRRQALAALTAELRIELAELPREFFHTTDLLDFPGARSRQKVDLSAFFEMNAEALKETFLRGKVSYLFERYVAEQELTSMLLCVRPSNQEVATLPDLVDDWIAATHGRTAKSRTGQPTLLFVVLTWFDSHFVDKAGDSGNAPGARFSARLDASLLGYFGKAHAWPRNWTDAGPFQNCYWFRNPNYPAESIIRYDGLKELDFIPEKMERIRELRRGFLSLPEAAAHFKDPARAFDEALRLNDGGITYLSAGLAEVCKPDLKLGQVSERLADLRHEVRGLIAKFYIDLDVTERLKLRRAAADRVFDDLESVVARNGFGSFLGEFLIDETDLTDVVYATLRGRSSAVARSEAQATQTAVAPAVPGRVLRPGTTRTAAPSAADSSIVQPVPQALERERYIARACLDAWVGKLMRLTESTGLQMRFKISPDTIRQIVDEKLTLIRRLDLESTLAAALKQILLVETAESSSPKAALVAGKHINRIVGDLGFGQLPPPQRPEIDAGEQSRRAFADRPVVNDARGIGAQAKDFAADYATDWFFGFLRVVEENVQNPHDIKVDLGLNAQLKEILGSLAAPRI